MKNCLFAVVSVLALVAGCTKNAPIVASPVEDATAYHARIVRERQYEIDHPKQYKCDLPTLARESLPIRKDPRGIQGLPGDFLGAAHPMRSDTNINVDVDGKPMLHDDDKPVAKLQQGNGLYTVYRLRETKELVLCSIDLRGNTCEKKDEVACHYNPTIIVDH